MLARQRSIYATLGHANKVKRRNTRSSALIPYIPGQAQEYSLSGAHTILRSAKHIPGQAQEYSLSSAHITLRSAKPIAIDRSYYSAPIMHSRFFSRVRLFFLSPSRFFCRVALVFFVAFPLFFLSRSVFLVAWSKNRSRR